MKFIRPENVRLWFKQFSIIELNLYKTIYFTLCKHLILLDIAKVLFL